MATTHKMHCRTHGGYFTRPARRGRPPVRCTDDYPCDKLNAPVKQATPAQVARAADKAMNAPRKRASGRRAVVDATYAEPDATTAAEITAKRLNSGQLSDGLLKAKQAKTQLEALGWSVEGTGNADTVSILAVRGTELLTAQWSADGTCIDQTYSLWDADAGPRSNGRPTSQLPFDPDEVPDRELVRMLSGNKVTWFNKLAGKTESEYIKPESLEITHKYNDHGDESPGARLVRFVGVDGGFRAFRLDALVKLG